MPTSSSPYQRSAPQVGRSKSDTSLMRDKNGCITCRVRQKKCSGIETGRAACSDCLRLNIQCLGVQHNRPDWLRNADALKETKYRIKHHLTEYPVPRGRGPAPERPYLNFFDLIEKYSPRLPGPEEYVQPEPSYRMESESPTISIPTPRLKVYPSHHASLSTPSPSSSYAPMPRTPVSPDGSLFPAESGCAYVGGVSPQDPYLGQPDFGYQGMPYVPQVDAYDMMVSPIQMTSPYRHPHPESLFLVPPMIPSPHDYLPDYTSPSARRQ